MKEFLSDVKELGVARASALSKAPSLTGTRLTQEGDRRLE